MAARRLRPSSLATLVGALVLVAAGGLLPAAAVLDTLQVPSGACSDPSSTYVQANR